MKFSIVIPAFNSKWICKCIDSVLNQTYKNYEIIVVDDLSTDKTYQTIMKNYSTNDKVKIIQNKSKRLSGGTRNVGILQSTGDYIICIDNDDWLTDNKVLEDINNKISDEDVMFLGFKLFLDDSVQNETILNPTSLIEAFNIPFPAAWLKVVKKSTYIKSLFPEGTLYEDRIQNFELIMNSKKITSLGRATHVWNRDNKNSTTYNPTWAWYRFEYCGELYRLINRTENMEYKKILINDLKIYIKSCEEMVTKL